jgi:hypothetical protein
MLRPKQAKEKNPMNDFSGLKDLSPIERKMYIAAIILAFISVFFWFFKILFF